MNGPDTLSQIDRKINDLDLLRLSRRITRREYQRRWSVLAAQRNEMGPPPVPVPPVVKWTGSTSSTNGNITNSPKYQALIAAEEQWRTESKKAAIARGAAARIWAERAGVIVCECDNPDCFEIISINQEEYLHACGPGYWRLTAPGCGYGCQGYRLETRGGRWWVWAKNG